MINLKKYFKVWWIFAINAFQIQMNIRWALLFFLFGKLLRFAIFTVFIILLVGKTKSLAGYSLDQTLLFFLTFNLIDTCAQLFFREVYRFRAAVLSGNFDFYLIKPISPLFRSLTAGPDLLDFLTFIPLLLAIVFFINRSDITSPAQILGYILLVVSGFVIALAFHIFVLSLAILTTEIDHSLMLYRDITALGRMPIDIYKEPIRGLLTFVIPVGVMMSFPVKFLLGLLSVYGMIYSVILATIFLLLSYLSWKYALKRYSSASS